MVKNSLKNISETLHVLNKLKSNIVHSIRVCKDENEKINHDEAFLYIKDITDCLEEAHNKLNKSKKLLNEYKKVKASNTEGYFAWSHDPFGTKESVARATFENGKLKKSFCFVFDGKVYNKEDIADGSPVDCIIKELRQV